jgi:chaperonin GroES
LLGPINESVNTIVNQLVDSGTLANLQAGFIGKGLRVKMGDHPLQPGEWRAVNAVGDDIRKQLIPIPAKEPSKTLFELLGMLITSGKELASVAEIFVGKMPGQNTPATTTMATIEQGMKVFTAIYKRLYRSLAKEFKKLYRLNHVFLDPATIVNVLDEPIGPQDFETKSYDICPGADPTAVSQTERLIKAQALLELLPFGVTDPVESIIRVLEAQEQPNWQKLIPGMAQTGQPQIPEKQDPKLQEMQMKMDIEQQKAAMAQQMQAQKLEFDRMSNEQKLAMEKMMAQMDIQKKQMDIQLDAQKAAAMQKIFMAESQQKLMTNEVTNQQKVRHQQEMNKSKLQQQSGKSGGAPKQGRPSRKGSSKG